MSETENDKMNDNNLNESVLMDGRQFSQKYTDNVLKPRCEIFKEKYSLLINPHIMEEIDYIIKNLSRVMQQIEFDTFKHMVACKILQEGTLLYGNEKIFHTVKQLLRDHRVTEKLNVMEGKARTFRREAEEALLREGASGIKGENLYLFYPTEESEEFE